MENPLFHEQSILSNQSHNLCPRSLPQPSYTRHNLHPVRRLHATEVDPTSLDENEKLKMIQRKGNNSHPTPPFPPGVGE